jgi:hypothetical protein
MLLYAEQVGLSKNKVMLAVRLMSSDLLPFKNQGQYHAQTKETRLQAPNSGSWYHVSCLFRVNCQVTKRQASTRDSNFNSRCFPEKRYFQHW